jgi:hypothetical protein
MISATWNILNVIKVKMLNCYILGVEPIKPCWYIQ